MDKKSKAIEYYDYLVKTNPNKSVHLKYYIRVYDDNCIEASNQPFLLEKECIYSVVEYVMISGSGFNTHIENVQLYFNNDGETFEYAPFENGQLKIDLRQAWSGFEGQGYYDCSYKYDNFTLSYNGAPQITYLQFYKMFLSYAKIVSTCKSQNEVDFLKTCLEKDIKIEDINKENLANQAKVANLEELINSYKDLICEIKKLVAKP